MSEPNSNHRSVGLPSINVQGNEPPIYVDHDDIVSSVLLTLATAATRNPEWVLDMLRDLDAVAVVEARGMSVMDRGSSDIIRAIYEVIGTPVVEMGAGQALQYAKRLEDAADSVSNETDRQARAAFRLREAQKLVSAAAVQNMAAQGADGANAGQTGTYDVRTLADRPTEGAPATHTGRPAQHSGRPIQDAPQA